jgi:PAS domain-containing protein
VQHGRSIERRDHSKTAMGDRVRPDWLTASVEAAIASVDDADVAVVLDPHDQFRILAASGPLLDDRMLAGRVVGRPLLDLLGHDQAAAARDTLERVLAGYPVSAVGTVAIAGAIVVLHTTFLPIADPGGAVVRIVATGSDLTTERRTLLRALGPGQIAQAVLDSIPSPTVVVDVGGHVAAVNAAWNHGWLRRGGDPAVSHLGLDYVAVCAAADAIPSAREVRLGLERVLTGVVDAFSCDYDLQGADATTTHWNVVIHALRTEAGGAVISHTDVTRRVRDQNEQRRIRRHYEALVARASDLVVVIDAAGAISYASPAIERILGWTGAQALGRSWLDAIHPEDRSTVLSGMERCRPTEPEQSGRRCSASSAATARTSGSRPAPPTSSTTRTSTASW